MINQAHGKLLLSAARFHGWDVYCVALTVMDVFRVNVMNRHLYVTVCSIGFRFEGQWAFCVSCIWFVGGTLLQVWSVVLMGSLNPNPLQAFLQAPCWMHGSGWHSGSLPRISPIWTRVFTPKDYSHVPGVFPPAFSKTFISSSNSKMECLVHRTQSSGVVRMWVRITAWLVAALVSYEQDT